MDTTSNADILDALSNFALRVARRLRATRPEWMKVASSFEGSDFIMCFPSPIAPQEYAWLASETDLEFVTVGFGPGHAHFSDWNGDGNWIAVIDQAIECLEEIMKGELVGVVFQDGSRALFNLSQLIGRDVNEVLEWRKAAY